MIADQTQWKQKYQQLKRDVQAQEKKRAADDKHHLQQTELLQQITRQLAVSLQGYDVQLDNEMDSLLQAINSGEPKALKKASRKLDKCVRASQTRKARTADDILSAVRRWIAELKSLTEQDMQLNALEVTRNLSSEAAHSYYDIPTIFSNILRLQSEIVDELVESKRQPDQKPLTEDMQLVLHHIAGDLLELIDGLHISNTDRKAAIELIQQLEQGFTLEDLPQVMHKTVKLVSQCSRSLNTEFERYLLDISRQLADMQHMLVSSYKAQQSNNKSHLDLNAQMQDEVDGIKTITRRAASLTQLKDLVSTQVNRIQSTVDNLKETEERRQQEADRRHQRLTAQLRSVEEEAQQTMARVEEERIRSRIDPLTKLPNRTAYAERIDQELEKYRQYRRPLSLAVCDIDHFKQVNDTYGHLAGDKALRLIASVFMDSLRNNDFVARYGGEEFVIVMPSTPGEEAARVLDKLRAAISASPFNFKGTPVPMTVSLGVTEATLTQSAEDLFATADSLLYRAKKEGRNRLCADFSDADVQEKVVAEDNLV